MLAFASASASAFAPAAAPAPTAAPATTAAPALNMQTYGTTVPWVAVAYIREAGYAQLQECLRTGVVRYPLPNDLMADVVDARGSVFRIAMEQPRQIVCEFFDKLLHYKEQFERFAAHGQTDGWLVMLRVQNVPHDAPDIMDRAIMFAEQREYEVWQAMLREFVNPEYHVPVVMQTTVYDRQLARALALQDHQPRDTTPPNNAPTLVSQEMADEFNAEVQSWLPW